ncbi:MAG: hypothetical protein HKN32_02815, partial [Flavobacteriales bacterium]|nr:hypothetical protein [Flavobacteriales bacterium]
VQGDSLSLSGDRLYVSNSNKIAQLRDNIKLRDREMLLVTDIVDYDLDTDIASYYGGGVITNRESQNRLTSEEGYYDSKSEFFHFRDNVTLKNPEYTILCDTLKYASRSETAWFLGPSTIQGQDMSIYCENGWYNTQTDKSQFNQNARITTGSTTLKGDSIAYDAKQGEGEIFCNVFIQDTTSNYIITGDYGRHNEKTGNSLVTDRALMIQTFAEDSLYMRADTLLSSKDSLGQEIKAFHSVRFFKSDLQGAADSLTYRDSDSLLTMFRAPVIWSKDSQITGDTIRLFLANGQLNSLLVDYNAFIASRVSEGAYNQIKGRTLVGAFSENKLVQIDINGNGQAIYFPLDESEGEPPKTIGVNKAECSNISIRIDDNQISRISMKVQPSGALHPPKKASQNDRWLPGFNWQGDRRPQSRFDLFPKTGKKFP